MKNNEAVRSLFFRFPAYFPATAWGLLILVLMAVPGSGFPDLPDYLGLLNCDKLVHLFLFATLAIIVLVGNIQKQPENKAKVDAMAVLICLVFAGITEVLQALVFVNREGSVLDFLADAAGIFLGWVLFRLTIEKKLRKYISNPKTL